MMIQIINFISFFKFQCEFCNKPKEIRYFLTTDDNPTRPIPIKLPLIENQITRWQSFYEQNLTLGKLFILTCHFGLRVIINSAELCNNFLFPIPGKDA